MQLEKEVQKKLHQGLVEMRMTEEKLIEIYAAGKVPGHIHSGMGQEGTYVGVLSTRQPGDYVKIAHRPVSASVVMGMPLKEFFGEIMAKNCGNSGGRGGINHTGRLQDGMLGFSATLGCDAAVPVGAAMTIDLEGRNNMVYTFFGDGTSNRGPVYEAMVLASDWKLPVLFVCENNGFAISTPTEYSSAVPNVLADKAAGFGMPSEVVDGTDVEAVYAAAMRLREYILAGNGPAVLECKSYRWRGHFEGDQCAYRDNSVAARRIAEKDCLKNFEAKLLERGVLSEAEMAERKTAYNAAMDQAIAEAEVTGEMTPETLFDYLYV
ncbi:thiamine pyrophosphate-dependent dehydrogenase E1 component subunit alpha [Dysosmobacter sp.]|uniref:thiamine pyrophosphate-dependent dehydrogenase E1 component subunit alpha n=1 Tax=Dysosmobacter sp. TaxID=2591382 RepID=UPI002A8AF6BD|nr:thiamine pyrophosphate-dependent dehydrogenase E1 component subunit alpha [Dysosmobacter sp.]MDY3282189.1 thiamine pyrophosphate-dependent dehydrogenase E1 component subunit alpha [Dysosmobacter sp.]